MEQPVIAVYDANILASISLPDPDDRHVLAAAIRAGAAVIVTYKSSPLVAFLS